MAMLCAWFCGTSLTGFAQSFTNAPSDTLTHLLRIYEDNDFINFWGKGTDEACTNGTRIDYFYRPRSHPHGVDRWMPAAGDSTIDSITDRDYQPNDYPWSAELIALHSR